MNGGSVFALSYRLETCQRAQHLTALKNLRVLRVLLCGLCGKKTFTQLYWRGVAPNPNYGVIARRYDVAICVGYAGCLQIRLMSIHWQ